MFYFKLSILSIVLLVLCKNCRSSQSIPPKSIDIRVNKCCEPNEILVDLKCANANESHQGTHGIRSIDNDNTL